jgi:hypothetical protein
VARMQLPAGRYMLTGKGQALNQQEAADVVSCNVYDAAGNHLDASTVSSPQPASTVVTWSYATLNFHSPIELSEAREVRVQCIGGDGIGVSVRLSALTVGGIVR